MSAYHNIDSGYSYNRAHGHYTGYCDGYALYHIYKIGRSFRAALVCEISEHLEAISNNAAI